MIMKKKKIKHNDLYELQNEIVIDFAAKTSNAILTQTMESAV